MVAQGPTPEGPSLAFLGGGYIFHLTQRQKKTRPFGRDSVCFIFRFTYFILTKASRPTSKKVVIKKVKETGICFRY
jgi:hypothetical protein